MALQHLDCGEKVILEMRHHMHTGKRGKSMPSNNAKYPEKMREQTAVQMASQRPTPMTRWGTVCQRQRMEW